MNISASIDEEELSIVGWVEVLATPPGSVDHSPVCISLETHLSIEQFASFLNGTPVTLLYRK